MREFTKKKEKFLKERNWHNLRPADVSKSISIEAAELLEHFQWENLSKADVKKNKKKLAQIEKELSDVMSYCFDLAVLLNIDLNRALNRQLDQIRKKYPKEKFENAIVTDPGTEELYWSIKRAHRR